MKIFLLLILISTQIQAQTTTNGVPSTTTAGSTSTIEFPTFSWRKLRDRTKMNYFSETLGPSLKKWDDNEVADNGAKLRQPMTMYHSFNTQIQIQGNFNFFLNPSVTTAIGDRNDLRESEENHVIAMDDMQIGFLYRFIKTNTLSYDQRLTHRHPFSVKSRNENIDSQIEWQHLVTYAITPSLRLIHWNNYRYYAYNQDATEERFRINFRTLFNYTLTDKWNLQMTHEWDMQHRNTNDSSSPKHRDPFFLKRYKNYLSYGVGYSPVRNLTFIPFIRFMDERDIRNETTMVGMWILGKIL